MRTLDLQNKILNILFINNVFCRNLKNVFKNNIWFNKFIEIFYQIEIKVIQNQNKLQKMNDC